MAASAKDACAGSHRANTSLYQWRSLKQAMVIMLVVSLGKQLEVGAVVKISNLRLDVIEFSSRVGDIRVARQNTNIPMR